MKLYSETVNVQQMIKQLYNREFSKDTVINIVGELLGDIDKLKEEVLLERSLNEEFFKQLWKKFCDCEHKLLTNSVETLTYWINRMGSMQVSKREVRKGIKMALDRGWLKPSEDKYYPNGYVIVGGGK